MKLLSEANISSGTKVLIRADIDVPIENGAIKNDYRLIQSLDTINYVLEKRGHPIICGHVGKPDGKVDERLSVKPIREWYRKHLKTNMFEVLENLRFDPREEENNLDLAYELSKRASVYINDSFATCHRKHASIIGVPMYIPGYAGLRLEKEVTNLNNLMKNPKKPFVAIVGGIKLESKKPALLKLLKIADSVLVGGRLGMDWKEDVPSNLYLPTDYTSNEKDIGPQTQKQFSSIIQNAKTIVWAGPPGQYEDADARSGTEVFAKAVVEATQNGAYSVVGGGNTIEALEMLGLLDKVSFVSTGGGAMLEYLVSETLPGIEVLK